nr:hypothetical protein [Micromonospora sp. DSM 115978]
MHALAQKNTYVGFLFMKISPEYFALGRDGIHEVSEAHARDMAKFSKQLTHVVCAGVSGKYDQVTMVEADSLEEIHNAATEFRMGAKARYIEIVDVVVGMKAPPRAVAIRSQQEAAERAAAEAG